MVQETVDSLADQIHPNVFSGLLDILEKLDDLVPAFSRTPNNCRGAMPDVVQQWRALAVRAIAFARDAIPQTSVYWKWFDCGADLGYLRRYPHDWQGHRLKVLQKKVQKLSIAIFYADPWLKQFCEFVDIDNSKELIDHCPDYIAPDGQDNSARFSRYLFDRILTAMEHDPLKKELCGGCVSGKEKSHGSAAGAGGNAGVAGENVKPQAIDRGAAGTAEVNPHQTPEPKLKAPDDRMFAAYRLKVVAGIKTQGEIAKILAKEYGKKIHQGTISVWLDRAEKWIAAGNVMPNLPGLGGEPQSIDPNVFEMGARLDGRTPRQREKWKEEDDE
jgi:hypothetical protein